MRGPACFSHAPHAPTLLHYGIYAMSLRDTYTQHAHERQTATQVKKLRAATDALVSDIDIVSQRVSAKGLKSLFAPLTTGMLTGEWSRENNTLSYTLVRDEVKVDSINYNTVLANTRAAHRDWMMVECKSAANDEIEKRHLPNARLRIAETMISRHGGALRSHEAYRALHRACADPSVDMRVELVVALTDSENLRTRFKDIRDYFTDIAGGVTATPRLQVRVYLDQPYRASSEAELGAKAPAAQRTQPRR